MRSFAHNPLGNSGRGSPSGSIPFSQVARDEFGNINVNNANKSFATTITSATVINLTNASAAYQILTGSTAQPVSLPDTSTIPIGFQILINNQTATALATIKTVGGVNTVKILAGKTFAIFTCISNSNNNAASWQNDYIALVVSSGKKFSCLNILTFSGNDNSSLAIGAGGTIGILGYVANPALSDFGDSSGGAFIGSSATDPGANNLKVAGNIIAGASVRKKGYTVATLPAGTQGDTAFVTDALTPTFGVALVGGGAVVAKAFYNGTAWVDA